MAERIFKTKWFAKASYKAHIPDIELAIAVLDAAAGKADDLGGGVFKKRLNDNMYRSIILVSIGRFWVYEYLFAKQDKANIERNELLAFRKIAKAYAGISEGQLRMLIDDGNLIEVKYDE
jgi:hypothetical protein